MGTRVGFGSILALTALAACGLVCIPPDPGLPTATPTPTSDPSDPTPTPVSVPTTTGDEICDNAADDDGDTRVDCADPDCAPDPACGGGGPTPTAPPPPPTPTPTDGPSPTPAPNQPPIADAGPDQTIDDTDGNGRAGVRLDGFGSSDADGSIIAYEWVEGDEELASDEQITLVIQVNGKLRDKVTVPVSITEAEAKQLAVERQRVKSYLEGQDIVKIIYVPGRLVNFVVK